MPKLQYLSLLFLQNDEIDGFVLSVVSKEIIKSDKTPTKKKSVYHSYVIIAYA